jgi:hypothetical protein
VMYPFEAFKNEYWSQNTFKGVRGKFENMEARSGSFRFKVKSSYKHAIFYLGCRERVQAASNSKKTSLLVVKAKILCFYCKNHLE